MEVRTKEPPKNVPGVGYECEPSSRLRIAIAFRAERVQTPFLASPLPA